jgi:sodium-coupled neutral amino acid transporter 9
MPEPQQPDARSAPLLDPENAVRCDTEGEAASGPSPQASEAPPPATKGSGSAALVFVLWNTMMGSTLLVMPSCFRESGWLLGLVLAVLCAGVSQYTCGVVLLHGMRLPDPQAEVADLAHAYLGRYGWGATLFASVGVCFGAACAMHGYLATSLNDLLVDSREQGGLGLASAWTSLSPNPKGVAAALVLALLLPLCSLRSMALLARLNGVGIACLFLILAFIGASAVANGLAPEALAPASLAQPSLKVLGTLALSFFIHSIAITIFRAAATPAHNARNLGAASRAQPGEIGRDQPRCTREGARCRRRLCARPAHLRLRRRLGQPVPAARRPSSLARGRRVCGRCQATRPIRWE